MKLLLDTHTILWWLAGSERLSSTARAAIAENAAECLVSAASIWEFAIKSAAGGASGPDLSVEVRTAGLPFLVIDERDAAVAGALPLLHRDPFDRMLVAQASVHELTIVTADAIIADYRVPVLW